MFFITGDPKTTSLPRACSLNGLSRHIFGEGKFVCVKRCIQLKEKREWGEVKLGIMVINTNSK